MSLVALVLGAIGVAMAMRAHLQQRLDTIAIMKSLGARSGQVIKIYLLQTLLLGGGRRAGRCAGAGVQLAFPYLLAKLISTCGYGRSICKFATVLTGLAVGILTTLLFTLPPLLDIRGVRPILILRRAVDDNGRSVCDCGIWRKITKNACADRGGCADSWQGWRRLLLRCRDSVVVGQVFSLGLVGVLVVLLAASAAVLAGLRFFLSKTRLQSAFGGAAWAGESVSAGESFGGACWRRWGWA